MKAAINQPMKIRKSVNVFSFLSFDLLFQEQRPALVLLPDQLLVSRDCTKCRERCRILSMCSGSSTNCVYCSSSSNTFSIITNKDNCVTERLK